MYAPAGGSTTNNPYFGGIGGFNFSYT